MAHACSSSDVASGCLWMKLSVLLTFLIVYWNPAQTRVEVSGVRGSWSTLHAVRPTRTGRTAAPVQPPLALTGRVKACACVAQSRTAALHNASPASRAITPRSTATDRRYDRETLRSGSHGSSTEANCPMMQSYCMSAVLRASVQDGCADRLAVRDFLVWGNMCYDESRTLEAGEAPAFRPKRKHTALRLCSLVTLSQAIHNVMIAVDG